MRVSMMSMRWRRRGFAALVITSSAGLFWLMALTLSTRGQDLLGIAMLGLFALTLPWTAIGFWNAVIGFSLMQFSRDPASVVAPHLHLGGGDDAIISSTALLICIRNEDTQLIRRNLEWMLDALVATGQAQHFHLYMLSDSSQPEIAADEVQAANALSQRFGSALEITYRRREQSEGFKAGNLREFCMRWGRLHPFAIVLDADSLMTPQSMLRLVRIMQRYPQIGILQTLVTGLPSASPFARIFQFGMRLGMRSYTLGSAFWQGDCGPYWGHNAILRLAPFIAHCELPMLPGSPPLGGHILSHDQVEAVLMRRAGFEVRVLPIEEGSWEENPPTLPEFIRRDLRWCQGNMQYFKLLGLPGLLPVSRCQLLLAIAMYLGSLAWLGLIVLGLLRQAPIRTDTGLVLFGFIMVMSFAPKIATLVDVLLRPGLRAAYGGGLRIAGSALLETALTMLVAPISAVAVSLFMLGLPFGRRVGWTSQQREAHGLPLSDAVRCLWPQTLLGLGLAAGTYHSAAVSIWFAAPIIAGLLLSVPLAMLSASPRLGRKMAHLGLCRTPEEAWPQFALGTGSAAGTPHGAVASPANLFAGRADPSVGSRP
jgi:membrane glycosyltransferase